MILLFLLGHFLFATEPDNISARAYGSNAEYANDDINKTINIAIDQQLKNYNATTDGCKVDRLYEFLKESFDKNSPTIYSSAVLNVPPAGPFELKDLPYKHLPIGKGVCTKDLSLRAPYNAKSFVRSVKVKAKGKTFYIGIDKVDHLFSHGHLYWKMIGRDPSLPAESVQRMLNMGIEQEEGLWGLKCTSVKSYADLSANYHGLYFWRDLLNGRSPILACENGRYVQKRKFDIADYIDPSMDESINCNSYGSSAVVNALKSGWDKMKMKCPADEQECADLRKSLPANIAAKILHPRCLGTGSYEVEKPSEITSQDYIDGAVILLLNKEPQPRSSAPAKALK